MLIVSAPISFSLQINITHLENGILPHKQGREERFPSEPTPPVFLGYIKIYFVYKTL